jgi:hypothetical protein
MEIIELIAALVLLAILAPPATSKQRKRRWKQ